jgi:Gram-negative porin
MIVSKTKIALAVALVATALSAQAEGFNFYALIDGGIANTSLSSGGTSKTEFVTGGYAPNFMGITAEKGLDKGMTGGIKLEQGFLLTGKTKFGQYGAFADGDSLFNREANLYLKGDFGKVIVGTQGNIAFATGVLTGEPRAGANFGSALAPIDLSGGLGTVDSGAISYTSNPSNGLGYGVQFVPENDSQKSGSRAALSYSANQMGLGVAYYTNTSTTNSNKTSGAVGSGYYKADAITVKGILAQQSVDANTYSQAFTKLTTVGMGGAMAVAPSTTLDFGVYSTTDSKTNYKLFQVGVGAQYKFLKDLTFYAQYAYAQNRGSVAAPFNYAGPSSTQLTSTLAANQNANTINLGFLYGFF